MRIPVISGLRCITLPAFLAIFITVEVPILWGGVSSGLVPLYPDLPLYPCSPHCSGVLNKGVDLLCREMVFLCTCIGH